MFVLKNAWTIVSRHPWRTLATALIAALVSFASLFASSVQSANATALGSGYDALKPAASLRPTEATMAKRNGADSSWTKNYLSWNDYTTYATALQAASLQFSYTFLESVPVRQSSSIKPLAGTADQPDDKTGGAFTLVGMYTADAMKHSDFGTFTVVSGKNLDYKTQDDASKQGVLISQSLAEKNNLKVGSTFTVGNPADAATTFTLKVRGIYTYTGDARTGSSSGAPLSKDNRENTIYTSYYGFGANNLDATDGKGWAVPDLNVVFELSSMSDYQKFVKTMETAKLPAKYEVTSTTLTDYRNSIAPLGRLARTTTILSRIMWAVGGLLLLLVVVLGLAKRREEIGMALVIGVSRARIGWQFMLEVLAPTLVGAAIGILASALSAHALGAALVSAASIAPSATIIWSVIGWSVLASVVLSFVALARVLLLRTSTIFSPREETV